MKNLIIMAVTIFAFAAQATYAGENSMSLDNAFSYTKSTQSGGSAGSANSAASAPGSFQGASGAILLGLLALLIVCVAVCDGGSDNGTTSISPTSN
jgi:hypothetical protein